jgi:hypothetical protein
MKLNGEFFAKRRLLAAFGLAKKIDEIDPWCNFFKLCSVIIPSTLVKVTLITRAKYQHHGSILAPRGRLWAAKFLFECASSV